MDHDRLMRFVVLADVLKLETLRQIDIKLWPIEGCLIFHPFIWKILLGQSQNQSGLSPLPIIIGTEILLRGIASSDREFDFEFFKTESPQQSKSKLNTINDLSTHRLGSTENMRIVLGETAHPHQSMQGTGQFRTVAGAQFGIT